MKRKFKVLYTHQKTKKHKTWHDGTLTLALNDDTRGSLTDDSKQQLTTLYLDKLLVEPGVEFDSGKYLIQVEEEIETSNLSQNGDHKATKMPAFSNKQSKALSLSKYQSVNVIAPLKRKRGFVVPRRAPDFTCDPQTSPNKSKVVPALSNDIGIWSCVNEADDNKPDFCGSANHVRGANDLLKMLGGLKHTEHDDNLKSEVTSLSFQPCKIEESEVKEKAVPSCRSENTKILELQTDTKETNLSGNGNAHIGIKSSGMRSDESGTEFIAEEKEEQEAPKPPNDQTEVCIPPATERKENYVGEIDDMLNSQEGFYTLSDIGLEAVDCGSKQSISEQESQTKIQFSANERVSNTAENSGYVESKLPTENVILTCGATALTNAISKSDTVHPLPCTLLSENSKVEKTPCQISIKQFTDLQKITQIDLQIDKEIGDACGNMLSDIIEQIARSQEDQQSIMQPDGIDGEIDKNSLNSNTSAVKFLEFKNMPSETDCKLENDYDESVCGPELHDKGRVYGNEISSDAEISDVKWCSDHAGLKNTSRKIESHKKDVEIDRTLRETATLGNLINRTTDLFDEPEIESINRDDNVVELPKDLEGGGIFSTYSQELLIPAFDLGFDFSAPDENVSTNGRFLNDKHFPGVQTDLNNKTTSVEKTTDVNQTELSTINQQKLINVVSATTQPTASSIEDKKGSNGGQHDVTRCRDDKELFCKNENAKLEDQNDVDSKFLTYDDFGNLELDYLGMQDSVDVSDKFVMYDEELVLSELDLPSMSELAKQKVPQMSPVTEKLLPQLMEKFGDKKHTDYYPGTTTHDYDDKSNQLVPLDKPERFCEESYVPSNHSYKILPPATFFEPKNQSAFTFLNSSHSKPIDHNKHYAISRNQPRFSPSANSDKRQKSTVSEYHNRYSHSVMDAVHKTNSSLTDEDSVLRINGLVSEAATHDNIQMFQKKSLRFLHRNSGHSPIVEANEENQILVNLKSRFVREIIFPTKDQANDLPFNSLPAQFTLVPLSYASVEEYIRTWSAVLYEQINKRIWEKGENFHALMQAADMSKLSGYSTELNETYTLPELKQTCSITDEELASMEPPYCSHERPSKICRVTKEGANQGRAFFTCALGKRKCNYFKWADDPQPKLRPQILPTSSRQVKINNERSLVAYLNRGNIDLYMNCHTVRKSRMTDGTSKSTAHLPSHGKRLLYLKLSRTSKSLCNIKDEVWALSSTFQFEEVYFVRVLSNSVSSLSEVVVQPLNNVHESKFNDGDKFHVISIINCSLEFACLLNLYKRTSTMPLLSHILSLDKSTNTNKISTAKKLLFRQSYDEMMEVCNSLKEQHKLNDEQTAVLNEIVDLLSDNKNSVSPILLIDGVFGSGKTHLLAVIITLISLLVMPPPDAPKSSGANWKVLLTSKKNNAIDGVLTCLLKLGFDNFVRIGNVDNIKESILPYSLHYKGDLVEHNNRLKALLKKCNSSDTAYQFIQRGLAVNNKSRLRTVPVIAATYEDSLRPLISHYKFPIIIMENANDGIEPLSLLPIGQFSASKLILAGDAKCKDDEINRSLFSRLNKMGQNSHSLITQRRYRPIVMSLLNNLCYDNVIQNQVLDPKKDLVNGLPDLCIYDIIGNEELCTTGGFCNSMEAQFISDLVKLIISRGIPGTSILIATTYDAQCREIKSALQNIEFYDLSDVNCIRVRNCEECLSLETHILLVSLVRTSTTDHFNSTRDIFGLLSRARSHVIIAANQRNLSDDVIWSRVVGWLGQQGKSHLQTSFQFKKFYQRVMTSSRDSGLTSEIPLRLQHPPSPQTSPRRDVTDDDSSQTDEDDVTVPTLVSRSEKTRKKRKFLESDSSSGDDVTDHLSNDVTDRCNDDVTMCEDSVETEDSAPNMVRRGVVATSVPIDDVTQSLGGDVIKQSNGGDESLDEVTDPVSLKEPVHDAEKGDCSVPRPFPVEVNHVTPNPDDVRKEDKESGLDEDRTPMVGKVESEGNAIERVLEDLSEDKNSIFVLDDVSFTQVVNFS